MDLFGKKRIVALEEEFQTMRHEFHDLLIEKHNLCEAIKKAIVENEKQLDELKIAKNTQAGEITWIKGKLNTLEKKHVEND